MNEHLELVQVFFIPYHENISEEDLYKGFYEKDDTRKVTMGQHLNDEVGTKFMHEIRY